VGGTRCFCALAGARDLRRIGDPEMTQANLRSATAGPFYRQQAAQSLSPLSIRRTLAPLHYGGAFFRMPAGPARLEAGIASDALGVFPGFAWRRRAGRRWLRFVVRSFHRRTADTGWRTTHRTALLFCLPRNTNCNLASARGEICSSLKFFPRGAWLVRDESQGLQGA
jgi:hypothetical protein